MPAIFCRNAAKPSCFAHSWQDPQSRAPATRNDIWASKSGPNPQCFLHFDFKMCFAPQRRALFRDLYFQKLSEPPVFLTCWLPNVFRATTACIFSTSQFPKVVRGWCVLHILTWKCASRHNGVHFFDIATSKSDPKAGVFCTFWFQNVFRATTACTFPTSPRPKVVRSWCVFYILTWKCASRHNGVQFFISHLASWLRTRRVSEPTFRPSGATNHWKNSVSRLSYLFAHLHFFSSDFFSDDVLSSNFSLLSASALLCFSSVHTVGSLTSKFPSIIITFITFFTFITFITVITVVIIIIIIAAIRLLCEGGWDASNSTVFAGDFFKTKQMLGFPGATVPWLIFLLEVAALAGLDAWD